MCVRVCGVCLFVCVFFVSGGKMSLFVQVCAKKMIMTMSVRVC